MCLELNKCKKCNGDIHKRKGESRNAYLKKQYCSRYCYESSLRPNRRNGETKLCSTCKKEIYVRKSSLKEHNFCSMSCHNECQGRNKTVHNCKTCGKKFKWSPSRIIAQNPTYCSVECRNKCETWKFNAVIKGNLIQQNRKTPSKLEVVGYSILDEIGVSYSKQVLIEEKFTVDAKVDSLPLVIQFDGDYWHGFREHGDDRPLDHRQQKRANLDKSQDSYMKKCGYVVLRFWEHEIYKEKEKVIETIRNAIQSITC